MPSLPPFCATALIVICFAGSLTAGPAPCDLKGEIAKTQRELKQVSQRAEQMRKQLSLCKSEVERLRKALAELKRKDAATLTDLAKGLAEAERRAAELEARSAGLEAAKTDLANHSKALDKKRQREIADLQEGNKELKSHLEKAAKATEGKLAEQRILMKRNFEEQRQAALESMEHARELHAKLEATQAEMEQALAEQRIVAKRELARHLTAIETAEKERDAALKELEGTKQKPAAAPDDLRRAVAGKLAAEEELKAAKLKIDKLSKGVRELTDNNLKVRAELVEEQTVRMRLQQRAEGAEAKLAAALAKPAPPVNVKPTVKVAKAPPALAVLRFDKNAAETARDRETLLRQVRAVIAGQPGVEFEIVGHTCDTGNAKANQTLSVRRATGVRDMLVRGGIPVRKLFTRGAGEAEPVADNRTLDGRRLNRRVEVHVR